MADCPADFLAPPYLGATGVVHVDAVVSDLIYAVTGSRPAAGQLTLFVSANPMADRNRLAIVLLAAWLLADPAFVRDCVPTVEQILSLLGSATAELATTATATRLLGDPDRREELVRFSLAQLSLRPMGESEAQAQDRLTTISSTERQRVIAAARGAEERARAIREQLAQKAAQEAADKWNRE